MAAPTPWGTIEVIRESELYPVLAVPTFGLEFEFCLLAPLTAAMQQAQEALRQLPAGGATDYDWFYAIQQNFQEESRKVIVDALQRAGLDTLYWNDEPKPTLDQYCVKYDSTVADTGESEELTLLLANGQTIDMEQVRQQSAVVDVEVNTRVLYFGIESLQEVSRAIEAIKSCHTWVNSSTGLHIHVGNGYGHKALGFNLKTLKNFCHLVCVAAHQLNELHPEDRTINAYAYQNFMQFLPEDRTPFRMARIIENCQTIEELVEFMHVNRDDRENDVADELKTRIPYMAYNFLNLTTPGGKGTIELRQHEGTLDADAVWRWVFCVCYLIKIASARRNPFAYITTKVHYPNYNIIDMFQDLGLNTLARNYFGHTYVHDRSVVPLDPADY